MGIFLHLSHFIPTCCRYLPGDPFSIKKVLQFKHLNDIKFQKVVEAQKESHDPENPRDYIDAYITRMNEERKVNPDSTFSGEDYLRMLGYLHLIPLEVLLKIHRLFYLEYIYVFFYQSML